MIRQTINREPRRRMKNRIKAFLHAKRGSAAVEFAVVVPIMCVMYLGAMELGQGIDTNKKISRMAATIGDLVTQVPTVTRSELNAILEIGASMIQPYNRSVPSVTITAIQMNGANPATGTIRWSRTLSSTGTTSGTGAGGAITVPIALAVPNSFLVRVTTQLSYQPLVTWTTDIRKVGFTSAFTNIPMAETYYMRPRTSLTVECTDC